MSEVSLASYEDIKALWSNKSKLSLVVQYIILAWVPFMDHLTARMSCGKWKRADTSTTPTGTTIATITVCPNLKFRYKKKIKRGFSLFLGASFEKRARPFILKEQRDFEKNEWAKSDKNL